MQTEKDEQLPFDIADKSFFERIKDFSEQQIIDNPKELISLLCKIDENNRAFILNPLFILSVNEEENKIRFDRQEWTTKGFKPKLHHALFYLARIPIENVPQEIQISALCVGSLILDSLLQVSGCAHANDEMLKYLWPVFLRFEKWIYAKTIDKKPYKFKATETAFAWMTQSEFKEASVLNGKSIFERSNEIMLGKAIKSCFRYAAYKKNEAIYRFLYGEPNRENVKEIIELFRPDATFDLKLLTDIDAKSKTDKRYSLPFKFHELMEEFNVAETTLRSFVKSESNRTNQYIKREKRGIYIYKSSQKDRITKLLKN